MTPLAVRDLASFIFRYGDLYPTGEGRSIEAWEGTAAHAAIQQRRKAADPHYQKEVSLKQFMVIRGREYQLQGRVDGITRDERDDTVIEEYKTSRRAQPTLRGPDQAQAWLYAGMLCCEDTSVITVVTSVVYISPEGEVLGNFETTLSAAQARLFLKFALACFASHLKQQLDRAERRETWAKSLIFPHQEFRKNQRAMAGQVFKSIQQGQNLLLEAATGSGKTLGVVFPALKAQRRGEQFFFLTSRSRGADAAISAIQQLTNNEDPLRVVQITAKEKICPQAKMTCDAALCPNAAGYYSRLPDALSELGERPLAHRQAVEACAAKHTLCPFELSLDSAVDADVIVCDYNYVFDPAVKLQRFLQHRQHSLLIDEAHQLSPRVTDMLSVEVSSDIVDAALVQASDTLSPHIRVLQKLLKEAADDVLKNTSIQQRRAQQPFGGEQELTDALKTLQQACDLEIGESSAQNRSHGSAEHTKLSSNDVMTTTQSLFATEPFDKALSDKEPSGIASSSSVNKAPAAPIVRSDNAQRLLPEGVLALYFVALRWQRSQQWTAPEYYRHITTVESARSPTFGLPSKQNNNKLISADEQHRQVAIAISRRCIDASEYSAQIMGEHRSVVRFSGTVSPMDLYQRLHGQHDQSQQTEDALASVALRAQSPFRTEQLKVLAVTDIDTFYQQRQRTLPQLHNLLRTLQTTHPGRYLLAMPSYEYLQQVNAGRSAAEQILAQSRGMDEKAQKELLQQFMSADEGVLGIVMGGVFAESIDLGRGALAGVVIVSLGLPPTDLSKTLTVAHFDQAHGQGWGQQVAYLQPALSRIVQAAGRVIRDPQDKGVVCLVDPRFADPTLKRYFPEHWEVQPTRTNQVKNLLNLFWSNDLSS